MKTTSEPIQPKFPVRAFTLIELLVVIAVIAILAGLLFTAMPGISAARVKSVARSELTQLTTAIEAYRAKYGSYPPDNPNSVTNPPLYYELSAAIITGTGNAAKYMTLDKSYSVNASAVHSAFNVAGLANASANPDGDDDRAAIQSFLSVKPDQIATYNVGGEPIRVLACSVDSGLVWRYNSTHPTNNPGSYDLWVDVIAGNRTNLIANWNN